MNGGSGKVGLFFFLFLRFIFLVRRAQGRRQGQRNAKRETWGCLSQTEEESDGARATDCLERVKGGGERLFISKVMSNSSGQSGLDRECDLMDE